MKCTNCAHENPKGAHFCNGCGAALEPRCSNCNAENPTGARFCNACGATLGTDAAQPPPTARDPRAYTPKHLAGKILTTRSALEGERKQVTVLFADVKGSMGLCAELARRYSLPGRKVAARSL